MNNLPEQNSAEVLAFPSRETLRYHVSELKAILNACSEAGTKHLPVCQHIGRVVQLLEVIDKHPDTNDRLAVHQLARYALGIKQTGSREANQLLFSSPAVRHELGRIAVLPHPSINLQSRISQELLEDLEVSNDT